tara:strand:+ start:170 stop:505 length:336 start_codon:yes stop_codon:yes gene_type:complete
LEVVVLLHALYQSVMVVIQYLQLSHQQEVVMEHLTDQQHNLVDLVVVQHQDNHQVDKGVVILMVFLHLKVIQVVVEEVKAPVRLDLVVVEVVLLKQEILMEIHMVEMVHLI